MTLQVDFKFNIHDSAFALAHLVDNMLSNIDFPELWELKTYPWYNGRERGFLLCYGRIVRDSILCITFGENRNSDNIFVDMWIQNGLGNNPPTVKDFSEEAWKRRKYFGYNQHYSAATYIVNLIKDFVVTNGRVHKFLDRQ